MINKAPIQALPDRNQKSTALKAVLNILKLWECSSEEKETLLGLRHSTFFKYQKEPEKTNISNDLLERLSYILNIHAALRILFSSPESVYGWVRKPNDAPFFNGKTAMDIMLQGRVVDLWEVCRRLDAQRGGWS